MVGFEVAGTLQSESRAFAPPPVRRGRLGGGEAFDLWAKSAPSPALPCKQGREQGLPSVAGRMVVAHEITLSQLAPAAHWRQTASMFDVARHGGSVGRPAGGFPIRSILSRVALGCVLLSGLLWLPMAQAGTLYHCTGSSGETVFSSSAAGYRDCKKISTYDTGAPRPKAPQPPISLARVAGSSATTAHDDPGVDDLAAGALKGSELKPGEAWLGSLANVKGSVETSARPLAPASAQRVSLASVQGSVETSAKRPVALIAAGPAGQWSYHESHDAQAPVILADDPGTRILRGAVYRVVRSDGSVEYTNLPPGNQKGRAVTMLFTYLATCVACDLHSTIHWGSVALNLTAYADTIRAASAEYGVDEAFLRAIIHAESAFNPHALSLKGAQGLMQLMPATASDMGVLDAFDTDQNIRGGARYLSLLLHDFNGDERLAAAAYNAGPNAVQRYSGVPPYAETQVYVERVGTLRKRYGAVLRPPPAVRAPG